MSAELEAAAADAIDGSIVASGRGRDLVADARVVKRGGTLCVVDVGVEHDDGSVVARALVTYKLSLAKNEA